MNLLGELWYLQCSSLRTDRCSLFSYWGHNTFCQKYTLSGLSGCTLHICYQSRQRSDHTHTHVHHVHTHTYAPTCTNTTRNSTMGKEPSMQSRAELSVPLTDCWASLPLELFYKHYNGPPIGEHCIPGMLTCLSTGWLQNHNLLSLPACLCSPVWTSKTSGIFENFGLL